ncbi:MAG TPA: DUF935 domain-containing protein, partial [Caulobacteraceae bacterium]|nr:DUF935 domain-containing protein [Caulobacteraceae bacterium]
MALVDYLGRPIETAILKEEIAGPSAMSVRTIWSGHPADGLTPQRLAAMLREAEYGWPLTYLELAEQMEEKDLHYLGVLGTRKRAVSQLELTVQEGGTDARSQKDADLVRDWLKRDQLQMELFDVLDAVGKGFSETEIIWDMSARQWMPAALKRRDPRWFQFDLIDGETVLLRDAVAPQPLPPFKFIDHRHPAKSGLPVRSGLGRCVAWAWLFKNYTIKDWVAFAEVFGMPLRIGKHDVGETSDNIRKLARAVADIGSDAAAVISKSMEIEFLDGKGQSAGGTGQLYKSLAEYLDQQMSKVVLGQTATTDAIAGGHAVGKVHNEVRRDIMAADVVMLTYTLNRDLVRPMVDLNHGPPPGGVYPKIVMPLPEAVDMQLLATSLSTLVPMGLKIPRKWVQDKMGAPEPEEGEEVLTSPSAAAPADGAEGGDGVVTPPPEDATDRAEASEAATDPAEAASAGFLAFRGLPKGPTNRDARPPKPAPPKTDAIDR